MSEEQQCAFDDWQQAAEQIEKLEETQKQQIKKQSSSTKTSQPSDEKNQQLKSQKEVAVDPKKKITDKIAQYKKLTPEQFEQKYADIGQNSKHAATKIGNPVLKSDKDFNNYAKTIVKRFDNLVVDQNATLDDDKLSLFVEELLLYTYNNLQWKNLHEITNKLKVVKKQRKTNEQKIKKQKQKLQRQKKTEIGSQTLSQKKTIQKKEDDLFGGAEQMNSKQEQEERKNKIIIQVKKKVESDDDDDFM